MARLIRLAETVNALGVDALSVRQLLQAGFKIHLKGYFDGMRHVSPDEAARFERDMADHLRRRRAERRTGGLEDLEDLRDLGDLDGLSPN